MLELRQTVSSHENNPVCQHSQDIAQDNASLLISPVSSSSEYYSESSFDGEDAASDNAKETGHFEGEINQEDAQNEINAAPSTPLQAIVTLANNPGYSIEFNSNTTAALNLNMVHNLTQEEGNRVTFSMDGKYLATASTSGVVSIFVSKTGERIMHK